jgi:hypothetical protein
MFTLLTVMLLQVESHKVKHYKSRLKKYKKNYIRRWLSSGILRRIVWYKFTDVSEVPWQGSILSDRFAYLKTLMMQEASTLKRR